MRNSGAPEIVAAQDSVYSAIAPLLVGFALGVPFLGIASASLLPLMALGTLQIGETAGEGRGRLVSGLQGLAERRVGLA